MADAAWWTLWNNSGTAQTVLRKVGQTGGTVEVGDEIVCPEPLTLATTGSTAFSTAVLRSLPANRSVVYYAGRSAETGHLVAYRYDDNTGVFTQLLDVDPTSGTWPFATGMWAEHLAGPEEKVWLVSGNGSGWGAFNNQNIDAAQGVWSSTNGAAFVTEGAGRHDSYAGSNINNPNSLQDIYVLESDSGNTPFVSHSPTTQFHNPPNSYPFWSFLSVLSGSWGDIPHSTGAAFEGGWVNLLSPQSTDLDTALIYMVLNGSGTGPYSLADSSFGSEYNLANVNPAGVTGLGPYHHNAACLSFRDDPSILLAFHTERDDDLGTIIDTHSPATAPISGTMNYIPGGPISPTCCRLAESGGAVIAITGSAFGAGTILTSLDYGASWVETAVPDSDGMATDAGIPPAPPPAPRVNLEVLTFRDSRMFAGMTRFWVSGNSDAEIEANALAIADALQLLTDCSWTAASGPYNTPPAKPSVGSDAIYQNIEMLIRLVWVTYDGVPIIVEVPAPATALFLDDQETTSDLNPDYIAAVTAGFEKGLCTRGGQLAYLFGGASRIMRGFRATETIRTLDPSETFTAE